ncbi:MAG: tautomerase family protein [Clostridia bacterium]|nr:tautomerase family protein [Clostridia bacterium]
MPYIAIKAYPKDEETKREVAEAINRIFLEKWGCPQQAISISFEEYPPEEWQKTVFEGEIKQKEDSMFFLSGEKKY